MSDNDHPPGWSPSNFARLADAVGRAASPPPTRPEFDALSDRVDTLAETTIRLGRIEERQSRTSADVADVLAGQQKLMEKLADHRRDVSAEIKREVTASEERTVDRIEPIEQGLGDLLKIKEKAAVAGAVLAAIGAAIGAVGSDNLRAALRHFVT